MNIEKNLYSEKDFQEKINNLNATNFRMIKFDQYNSIKNVELITDSNTLEGDTFADLSYNDRANACKKYKMNISFLKSFFPILNCRYILKSN